MSDSLPTATRVSDPGIRALYRLENRWQAWLDVEAALAKAQAELGIIPKEAAASITRAARLELLDRARIDEGFARTGHTLVLSSGSSAVLSASPMAAGCIGAPRRRTSRRPATCWCCDKRIGFSSA
jgi:hypothetical protein